MTELSVSEITIVARIREAFPHLVALYLHGSAAKGQIRPESDIDIALLFKKHEMPDRMKLFFLAPVIEEAVGRRVDLSILATENTVFAKEVLVNGKQLFCRDAKLCEQFAMYVYSFYGKLNDERAEIISTYQHHQ
jgi:predicted nucleotidyltransferase